MLDSPWGVVSGSECFLVLLEASCFISSEPILFGTISLSVTDPADAKNVINIEKRLAFIIREK